MENNNTQGASTPTGETQTPVEEKNYKDEYQKAMAEVERLKNSISETNSENANFKRQLKEKMTDDEKKAEEQKEFLSRYEKLEADYKRMVLEKDLLSNGFTAEESQRLIEGNFAIKDLADIMKARVEANTKLVKATMIKDSTPDAPMGNGTTTNPNTKSEFKVFQEAQNSKSVTGRVEL